MEKNRMKKISILFVLFTIFAFQATSIYAMESECTIESEAVTVGEEMDRPAMKRKLEVDEEMDVDEKLDLLEGAKLCSEPTVKRKKIPVISLNNLYGHSQIQSLLETSDKIFFSTWAPFCINRCNKLLKNLEKKIEKLEGHDKEEMLDVKNKLENELLMLIFKALNVDDLIGPSKVDALSKQISEMEVK
jgi:hypothetical protein